MIELPLVAHYHNEGDRTSGRTIRRRTCIMKHSAVDFLSLRSQIIKNSVLNTLLASTICNTKEPIVVGNSLIRLTGKTRSLLFEQKGPKAKLPKYIMADVLVTVYPNFSIGYSYNNLPITWIRQTTTNNLTKIGNIKCLAAEACSIFSINASKNDTIFSEAPESLSTLLEAYNVSANYWKTGFSKKLKTTQDVKLIKEEELEEYRKKLMLRLTDWRNFNIALIGMLKEGQFQIEDSKIGKLTMFKAPFEQMFTVRFESYVENVFSSNLVNHLNFTPRKWCEANMSVDLFTMRNLFKKV